MLYNTIADIIVLTGFCILAYMKFESPTSFVTIGLCTVLIVTRSILLADIIRDIRAEMPPKRRTRRKKQMPNSTRRIITITLMLVVTTIVLYLIASNGVKLGGAVILLSYVVGALVGLILS